VAVLEKVNRAQIVCSVRACSDLREASFAATVGLTQGEFRARVLRVYQEDVSTTDSSCRRDRGLPQKVPRLRKPIQLQGRSIVQHL